MGVVWVWWSVVSRSGVEFRGCSVVLFSGSLEVVGEVIVEDSVL